MAEVYFIALVINGSEMLTDLGPEFIVVTQPLN